MDLTLPPHLEHIIQEKIESGRYQTPREVVEVALRLLEERDVFHQERLDALRGELQPGLEALAQGDHQDYADWRDLAEEIKAEGRTQATQPFARRDEPLPSFGPCPFGPAGNLEHPFR